MKYREPNPNPNCACGIARRTGQRTCKLCHRRNEALRRATVSVLKVMRKEAAK